MALYIISTVQLASMHGEILSGMCVGNKVYVPVYRELLFFIGLMLYFVEF